MVGRLFQNKLVPKVLVIAASAAICLWAFIELAEEVLEGGTRGFDHAVLLALRVPGNPAHPLGPAWLEGAARDLTALGSIAVLGLIIGMTTLFLVLARRRWTALFVLISTAGGIAMLFLMKQVFGRARPDLFPHGDSVVTASFPSGHAMLSALVYLTLGALVSGVTASSRLKAFVMTVALLLTGIVGATRVYLGVHWPTDVLAGWAAGALWALVWWTLLELAKNKSRAHQ